MRTLCTKGSKGQPRVTEGLGPHGLMYIASVFFEVYCILVFGSRKDRFGFFGPQADASELWEFFKITHVELSTSLCVWVISIYRENRLVITCFAIPTGRMKEWVV